MFEAPSAKRLKRSQLFSSGSSPASSDNEAPSRKSSYHGKKSSSQSKLAEKSSKAEIDESIIDYGFEYDFIDTTTTQPTTHEYQQAVSLDPSKPSKNHGNESKQAAPTDPKEQTFEFNLFKPNPKSKSTSTTTPHPAQQQQESSSSTAPNPTPSKTTITIRSPSPDPVSLLSTTATGPGSILKPRPLSSYLTAHLSPTTLSRLQSEYHHSALSGSLILATSTQTKWPGTHLPWREIHIPPTRLISMPSDHLPTKSSTTSSKDASRRHPRPRPSKKRRIVLRTRVAARLQLQAQSKLDAEAKEIAEREKRTRRNREKKVKRKGREKAKKQAASVEKDGEGEDDEDGDERQGDEGADVVMED